MKTYDPTTGTYYARADEGAEQVATTDPSQVEAIGTPEENVAIVPTPWYKKKSNILLMVAIAFVIWWFFIRKKSAPPIVGDIVG